MIKSYQKIINPIHSENDQSNFRVKSEVSDEFRKKRLYPVQT